MLLHEKVSFLSVSSQFESKFSIGLYLDVWIVPATSIAPSNPHKCIFLNICSSIQTKRIIYERL